MEAELRGLTKVDIVGSFTKHLLKSFRLSISNIYPDFQG